MKTGLLALQEFKVFSNKLIIELSSDSAWLVLLLQIRKKKEKYRYLNKVLFISLTNLIADGNGMNPVHSNMRRKWRSVTDSSKLVHRDFCLYNKVVGQINFNSRKFLGQNILYKTFFKLHSTIWFTLRFDSQIKLRIIVRLNEWQSSLWDVPRHLMSVKLSEMIFKDIYF